jgi:serine/threonine protein kinase
VHGDLRGVRFYYMLPLLLLYHEQANILINDDNQACLADFVVTTIFSDMTPSHTMNVFGGGTLRWMAPELLIPNNFGLEKCVPSKESDIYAFGMVIYEVVFPSSDFLDDWIYFY